MLKLLGSVCIFSGGILARWLQVSERRRRWDTLSDLLTALRQMAEEIRMARTPLPDLLEKLAEGKGPAVMVFFQETAKALRRGEKLETVWQRLSADLPLSEQDRRTAEALGRELHGDEENACKAIALAVYQLAASAEVQARERKTEDRKSAALWYSAAALLVILLI